ncbi:MAG: hypothetical protein RMI35_04420 [Leptospiraceae bacterium]|nr:hypothetical protein [Leptospiraceae bacterium]
MYVFLFILVSSFGIFLINYQINKKFQNKELTTNLFKKFSFLDSTKITYQYATFHIMRGLKINHAQIQNEKFECNIETVLIEFQLFQLSNTPKKIIMKELSCSEKKDLLNYNNLQSIAENIKKHNITWKFQNLKLINHKLDLQNFEITITPKEDYIEITGFFIEGVNKTIKIHGNWDTKSDLNRIHFTIQNHAFKKERFFEEFIDVIKTEKQSQFLNDKLHFYFNGRGSIDLSIKGFSFNVIGKYHNLKGNMSFLELNDINGNLHYTTTSNYDKSIFHEEYKIQIQSKEIQLSKLIQKDQKEIKIQGEIPIDNQKIKTQWNTKGNVFFQIDWIEKNFIHTIKSTLSGRNLIVLHSKELPLVFIESVELKPIIDNQWELLLKGKIDTLPFSFVGSLFYSPKSFPKWVFKGSLSGSSLDYQSVFDIAYKLIHHQRNKFQEDSLKTIEYTKPWKDKFIKTDFYQNVIKNTKIEIQIEFLQPKQNLPELKGKFIMNELEARLDLYGNQPSSKIQMNYSVNFLTNIPQQHFNFFTQAEEPQIEIPFLCNLCANSIKKLEFQYTTSARGLKQQDFYLNNSSSLRLDVDSVILKNDYRKEMIEKLLQIQIQDPVRMKLEYSSAGAYFHPVFILIENSQFLLRGTGNFNIYVGGEINFHFYDKQKLLNKNFLIKLRKDGAWIPSYFY